MRWYARLRFEALFYPLARRFGFFACLPLLCIVNTEASRDQYWRIHIASYDSHTRRKSKVCHAPVSTCETEGWMTGGSRDSDPSRSMSCHWYSRVQQVSADQPMASDSGHSLSRHVPYLGLLCTVRTSGSNFQSNWSPWSWLRLCTPNGLFLCRRCDIGDWHSRFSCNRSRLGRRLNHTLGVRLSVGCFDKGLCLRLSVSWQ